MVTKAGRFLTVEGTEGVGKSTNIAFIMQYLTDKGIDFVATREPGGTPLAEELRSIMLANRDEKFDPLAELLTMFAARAQHIAEVIKPALDSGTWVLSDRFTDATYAYQGFGRGRSIAHIEALESMVQGTLRPDKTFLLDIDVKKGLERAAQRGELDRFEQEEITFFERVRQGYQTRVQQSPNRYSVIDAGQELVDVQKDIKIALDNLISGF